MKEGIFFVLLYGKENSCMISLIFRIWAVSCDKVKTAIVDQIHKWTSADNCPEGQPGEKCLYTVC